jgi:hypothetical protein
MIVAVLSATRKLSPNGLLGSWLDWSLRLAIPLAVWTDANIDTLFFLQRQNGKTEDSTPELTPKYYQHE